jgi:two-component system, sensor histidine kinase YesM
MFRTKTIQAKLFISYSIFILLMIAAFVVSYYIYTARALESKSADALYQLSGYIMSQLDGELQGMNSLSDKILFSEPLKKRFYSDIYDLQKNASGIYEQREFYDILYSITGPQVPVSQVNMIQLNGNFVGLGGNSSFTKLSPETVMKMPWMDEILKLNGSKFITVPHMDLSGPHAKEVISLDRAFSVEYGRMPDSVIEVQQDYGVFADIVAKALNTPDVKKVITQKVYVFNSGGELVYPLEKSLEVSRETVGTYWQQIKKNLNGMHTFSLGGSEGGNKTILAFTGSDFSGWTAAVTESESIMLSPVLQFRNRTIAASVMILLLSLALSYFVARGLTVPIKKIHKNIKSLSLETITGKEPVRSESGLNEFEDLNRSFAEMCIRLKSSLEEAVSARSHEIQAQMLALQSQMNPHFLYNTITIISIMAESEGNDRILKACMDLSGMLRYISAGSSGQVTVQQELEHTLNYLNLMKARYQDKLNFTLDIPEYMNEIKIPKLTIQPLVENCTKYALNLDPPWKIGIVGRLCGEVWEIAVHDNGQGFDEKWLAETQKKLDAADSSQILPGLKLDGMGLVNIYLRLKLKYGEKAVFRLHNNPEGGAAVTVGGIIIESGDV